ncbi:DUF6461 domain-containing protein [Amycolatopsis nigrescens]|uniref:DUF6461 domain-containing protein n=1 Tax=Amycolatopsis nigrescens TaxID=381445 RepID=UPI000371386E|nr:DUF6461 domain-containing protein [Amycolatopsis nigrescens]
MTTENGLPGQTTTERAFDPPAGFADEIVSTVVRAMPLIMAAVPATPAAELGRSGANLRDRPWGQDSGSLVFNGLQELRPVLTERLLGALELTVDNLSPTSTAGFAEQLAAPGSSLVTTIGMDSEGDTTRAVKLLDALRPGVTGMIYALTAELAGYEKVAGLLTVTDSADEAGVAARHGTAHLALAVATAAIVLRTLDMPVIGTADTVVGVALGVTALRLRETAMPTAYAGALLEKRRVEYLLPRAASGSVLVHDHRFALAEGAAFPEDPDFSRNGLVDVTGGGLVIRTGIEEGWVSVTLRVLEEPPAEVDAEWWDEVVEASWTALTGSASVFGPRQPAQRNLRDETPPWPGDYRVRVHANGRDTDDERESYELVLWSAPRSAELVYETTDRLGHRLRGEPEPPVISSPEDGYRWVNDSALQVAATVTVATGITSEEVLHAFGADPAEPAALTELREAMGIDPWVAVLEVDGAVVAIEENGYQGSYGPVLRPLSQAGRAASMYWNVNAVTRLSMARNGEVLMSCEPGTQDPPDDPEVTAALEGLDLDDFHNRIGKGLVAVERFTGHELRPGDLDRIKAACLAYRILPRLSELYREERLPDGSRRSPGSGPLGADTDELAFLPDESLRDLAWWAANEAVVHAGLNEDSDVRVSLSNRELSANAEIRARTTGLEGRGAHHWMWEAVHRATNPDPLGAAIGALDAARYAAAGAAAELLDRAHRRIAEASS